MSRRSLFSSQFSPIEEPLVNLTPLIDVVFVILIAFIVMAPLLELDRVELADGAMQVNERAAAVQESSPITLHVKHDNSLTLNGQPIPIDRLPFILKGLKERYPQARPQLFHDKTAHFGTYQTIKNSVEAAGFEQMDIILKPSG